MKEMIFIKKMRIKVSKKKKKKKKGLKENLRINEIKQNVERIKFKCRFMEGDKSDIEKYKRKKNSEKQSVFGWREKRKKKTKRKSIYSFFYHSKIYSKAITPLPPKPPGNNRYIIRQLAYPITVSSWLVQHAKMADDGFSVNRIRSKIPKREKQKKKKIKKICWGCRGQACIPTRHCSCLVSPLPG